MPEKILFGFVIGILISLLFIPIFISVTTHKNNDSVEVQCIQKMECTITDYDKCSSFCSSKLTQNKYIYECHKDCVQLLKVDTTKFNELLEQ